MRFARHAMFAAALLSVSVPAQAQTPGSKFKNVDNSFIVEEAFNQETGVVQNIFVMSRSKHGVWDGAFSQEWPIGSERHQASFEIPFSIVNGSGALGDIELNYRLQVFDETGSRPAFAPRLTVRMPASKDLDWDDGVSWEVMFPVSKAFGRLYVHGNAGTSVERHASTPFLGGSAIVAVTPMSNLMLEARVDMPSGADGRDATWVVSPGFRTGWNLGEKQIVVGVGVPVTRGVERNYAVLGYFSYELPFKK